LRLSLLIVLMSAAAPVMAAPPASGPIVKDGVEIDILPFGPSGGDVVEITLDVEARSDAAASRLGFRSMRGVTAIDCAKGANRFIKADAFAEAELKGPPTPRMVSGDWVRPSDDSFMRSVTLRVCGEPPAAPVAPASPGRLPVVTMGAASSPASPPAHIAATPPPTRLATAAAPAPTASAPPARAFRTSATGRGVAQVAASPTAEGAQHVLDRLRTLITPPLTSDVEAATVNNAHLFRASVLGFVSLSDAQAFCARAASVSKTCWVHWKAAEAPQHHP
jgi:hypothetical protein